MISSAVYIAAAISWQPCRLARRNGSQLRSYPERESSTGACAFIDHACTPGGLNRARITHASRGRRKSSDVRSATLFTIDADQRDVIALL